MKFSRFLITLLAGLLLPLAPAVAACRDGDRITLLHFNDFHGQLESYGDPDSKNNVGGIARLATAVARVRAEDPSRPVLLLFAGDLLQGTLTSSVFLGIPDVTFFERLGVDAAVVGNHEFDYGQDVFRRLGRLARFPFLAANLRGSPDPLPIRSHALFAKPGGPRVAVLGLTTPELTTTTHPRNAVGLSVEDPLTVTHRLMPELRAEADMVVALSHMGTAADRRLAREVPDLAVVVGGHTHQTLAKPLLEGEVAIVQAGERGRWLGRMDFACSSGRMRRSDYQLLAMDGGVPEDAETLAEVRRIVREAEKELMTEIGQAQGDLDGRREVLRRGEAAFGNFVADLAREVTHADLALFNGGGIRAGIPGGPVTLKHVFQAFPFRNELVVGSLTGAQIINALEHSAGLNPSENPGGFLQVAGIRYVIADGRLESAHLGSRPLNPAERYRVAMPDFLAEGGDGYAMFREMEDKLPTGRLIADLVIEAFRSGTPVTPRIDGRIERR